MKQPPNVARFAAALEIFESRLGREVTNDFTLLEDVEKRLLLDFLQSMQSAYESLAKTADCLPLHIDTPSDYLAKRSLLYSSNTAYSCPDRIDSEYFGTDLPSSYIELLRRFHPLIRADVLCIGIGQYQYTDSAGSIGESEYFDPKALGAASVSASEEFQSTFAKADPLHFKLLLPDVSGISVAQLASLAQDEEIFHNYHNTINLLNLKRHTLSTQSRLAEIMREVDDRTRELNSRFLQLKKKRTWQAVKSIGGLSLTGFTYLLPTDIGTNARAVFGSLSAIAIADSVLGLVQTRDELRSNPYYFAYAVHSGA